MNAEAAVRQIIAACNWGDAEVVLSTPALIGVKFHALFPGLTADLLSWVNRYYPPLIASVAIMVKEKTAT